MKFASWNVNSINLRMHHLCRWIKENNIDVICLQELKCSNENFPKEFLISNGLNFEIVGQKSYNGVAIVSRKPIKLRESKLPNLNEDISQARYLEVEIDNIIFSSIYVPNGNPINSEKYDYKIIWMEKLYSHAKKLLSEEKGIVLAGDYNVIPSENDCWDPNKWENDALALPEVKNLFRKILYLGYYDAFRSLNREVSEWTFWDYQGGAWNKDNGIRIDHLILNSLTIDKLKKCKIDKSMRGVEKPSDHVPILGELSNE